MKISGKLLLELLSVKPPVPVTEKIPVKDGIFFLNKKPVSVGGYYFVNNMVLIEYNDKSFDLYTDVTIDLNTLQCTLSDKITGTCTVTYFTSM